MFIVRETHCSQRKNTRTTLNTSAMTQKLQSSSIKTSLKLKHSQVQDKTSGFTASVSFHPSLRRQFLTRRSSTPFILSLSFHHIFPLFFPLMQPPASNKQCRFPDNSTLPISLNLLFANLVCVCVCHYQEAEGAMETKTHGTLLPIVQTESIKDVV